MIFGKIMLWIYHLFFKPKKRRSKMIPRFEVFEDRKKQWRFRLRAINGKIICASEGYVSRRNAIKGIKSIQECAPEAIIIYSQK